MKERSAERGHELDALPKVDALVVLGRNLQPGFGRKELAKQRFHLSPQSRINALVGGILYDKGYAARLIHSSGHTAGSNLPSEAGGMKSLNQSIFRARKRPKIPDFAFLLDEKTVDTEGNAKQVKKIVHEHPEIKSIGLLTDTSHLPRAVATFEAEGLSVVPFDSLDILRKYRERFVDNYITSDLYKATKRQDARAEWVRTMPLFSPVATRLLHLYLLLTRNPHIPNPYVK